MPMAMIEKVGRAILIVHPQGAMPPAEWRANLAFMREHAGKPGDAFVVVWADGVIDTAQRKEVIDLIKNRPRNTGSNGTVRTMMFTSNMLTRGVMQALSWMGANVGSYNKASLLKDLAAEGFSDAEALELQRAIARCEKVIFASAAADATDARR